MISRDSEHLKRSAYLRVAIWIIVAIGLLAVPHFTNDYVQFVLNMALVYVLVTLGFNLVIGFLGQLAFANAALFGIGAYTTGIVMAKLHWSFAFALIASAVCGSFCGIVIGLPALRGIRKFYLAIITMAAGELLRWAYIHADWLTNGSTGLEVPNAFIFDIKIQSETSKYYLFLTVIVPCVLFVRNILRSRIGRAIVAIRESEQASTAVAIPTSWYFVLAFGLSGLIVGIAGSLFAISIGRVVPESFNLIQLIQQFAMVMLGGLGSILGSIIGALVVTAIPEITRGIPGLEELLFSAVLVLVILIFPKGLAGIFKSVSGRNLSDLIRGKYQ